MRTIPVYVPGLSRWVDISCPSLSPTVLEFGASICHHLVQVERVSEYDLTGLQLVAGKHIFPIPTHTKHPTQQTKLEKLKVDDLMLGRVLCVIYGKRNNDMIISVSCGSMCKLYTMSRSCTIHTLQHMISRDIPISIEQQRLFWNSKEISHGMYVTLADVGIQHGDKIHVMPKLLGGSGHFQHHQVRAGIPFVDLSDEKGLQRVSFALTAPIWRRVGRGLNLEGICNNILCQAYNNRVIIPISLQGYELVDKQMDVKSAAGTTIRTSSPHETPGLFDLTEDVDAHTCQCPACHQFVTPDTCGFWDCWWRWCGKMRPQEGVESRYVESIGWKHAPKDVYTVFDPKDKALGGSGIVTWFRLQIEIILSDMDPNSMDECSICLESLHEHECIARYGIKISTSCQHTFHEKCLTGWKKHTKTCPQCRQTLI